MNELDRVTVTVPTGPESVAAAIVAARARTNRKTYMPVRARMNRDDNTTEYDLLGSDDGPHACAFELARIRDEER